MVLCVQPINGPAVEESLIPNCGPGELRIDLGCLDITPDASIVLLRKLARLRVLRILGKLRVHDSVPELVEEHLVGAS